MIAFLVTLAFSLYMTGMIWSMQILEYPLFALVGQKEFPSYHRRQTRAYRPSLTGTCGGRNLPGNRMSWWRSAPAAHWWSH
jgi:hypothetical protein